MLSRTETRNRKRLLIGIIASVYTDLVQGLVMMIAAVLVLFAAMSAVDGGFAGMSRIIQHDDHMARLLFSTARENPDVGFGINQELLTRAQDSERVGQANPGPNGLAGFSLNCSEQ